MRASWHACRGQALAIGSCADVRAGGGPHQRSRARSTTHPPAAALRGRRLANGRDQRCARRRSSCVRPIRHPSQHRSSRQSPRRPLHCAVPAAGLQSRWPRMMHRGVASVALVRRPAGARHPSHRLSRINHAALLAISVVAAAAICQGVNLSDGKQLLAAPQVGSLWTLSGSADAPGTLVASFLNASTGEQTPAGELSLTTVLPHSTDCVNGEWSLAKGTRGQIQRRVPAPR